MLCLLFVLTGGRGRLEDAAGLPMAAAAVLTVGSELEDAAWLTMAPAGGLTMAAAAVSGICGSLGGRPGLRFAVGVYDAPSNPFCIAFAGGG